MTERILINRLAETGNPYLLQHADNPVAWQPWDEAALTAARELNRPILLSSGYSSCHWCHVMAHESFEDDETARLMNALFVNIKLDREERPDIDMIYQTAHRLMTQRSGGWPLTAFLSPHTLRPFFCGTYFPKTPRHGLPSFKEVLTAVAERARDDAVGAIGKEVQTALQQIYAAKRPATRLPENLSEQACDALLHNVDSVNGGVGGAPKFPQTDMLQCMLRQYARDRKPNTPLERALRLSLESICQRGLYDHLGGGFFRYCTDELWHIPHFEKMLYDNGLLLGLLADAHGLFRDMSYIPSVALTTAQWLERDMQENDGGYYSALDADNAEGEGAFYAWSAEEIRSLLSAAEADCLFHHFGLTDKPNYAGRWHFCQARDDAPKGYDSAEFTALLRHGKQVLLKQRYLRPPPERDNKCLPAWNALAIKGMAKASLAFDNLDCLTSAERALNFIRVRCWRDGRLRAVSCNNKVYGTAFLNDYAYLLDALLEMLQCRWHGDDLKWAREIADCIIKYFENAECGGYYFTAHDAEQVIQRPVVFYDDAQPSGYGIAALTLARLGHLCGVPEYVRSAERAIEAASSVLAGAPAQCASLLFAYDEQLRPPRIVIIRADDTPMWRMATRKRFCPNQMSFIIPSTETDLPLALATKQQISQNGTAYVCAGTQCLAPVTTPEDLMQQLAHPL